MMKLLCFGNSHNEKDRLALEVGKIIKKRKLRGLEVIECGLDFGEIDKLSASELDSVVVLDVVKGLERVRFVDVEELKTSRTITAHDIDVAFYLKLLAKEGKAIKVVGIPGGMEASEAVGEVGELLSELFRKQTH
ncbi:MAG: hypothetical protein ABIF01_02350 [Candidatus Micrarchaeota archaeon]